MFLSLTQTKGAQLDHLLICMHDKAQVCNLFFLFLFQQQKAAESADQLAKWKEIGEFLKKKIMRAHSKRRFPLWYKTCLFFPSFQLGFLHSGWTYPDKYLYDELLLATEVSTSWVDVVFRVKWLVFVSWWCYKSGPLNVIGQWSQEGFGTNYREHKLFSRTEPGKLVH